jgi:integrase
MTEEQVHTFLSSFDRSTAIGQRDYGVAMLMATLGLRASEVALLQLDDMDWREASLRIVSPKSRRVRSCRCPSPLAKRSRITFVMVDRPSRIAMSLPAMLRREIFHSPDPRSVP